MDTSETKTVTSQSIIGQICFDLATLYFYKGNIEKAKNLFETCSGVQVNVPRVEYSQFNMVTHNLWSIAILSKYTKLLYRLFINCLKNAVFNVDVKY